MVCLYQGIDLVDIRKVERVFRDRGRLLDAVFTKQERTDSFIRREPWKHLAGHFAAKEAFLKAFGIGLDALGMARVLRDIEIVCWREKPEISVHGWLGEVGHRQRIHRWSLCMGQASFYAVAAVVLEQLPQDTGGDPPAPQ
jgi:holo-[acyl-carrier protein] synthase